MTVKKRIGLMGGTFNPIHMGHLIIAEEAREKFALEKVVFIPILRPTKKWKQLRLRSDCVWWNWQ